MIQGSLARKSYERFGWWDFQADLDRTRAVRPGRREVSLGVEASLNASICVQEDFHFFPKS
jgi:hypothetical protein